ncbi:MAG2960 family serine endopeptidase lipoprotein [Metamycoplasma alkalescens]|uniref:MAG2960 family serine endopeptidase lipoprotein n=1 Tax=Metamycoplasma alkalescens TaxID=45363 RepID=UPI003D010B5E
MKNNFSKKLKYFIGMVTLLPSFIFNVSCVIEKNNSENKNNEINQNDDGNNNQTINPNKIIDDENQKNPHDNQTIKPEENLNPIPKVQPKNPEENSIPNPNSNPQPNQPETSPIRNEPKDSHLFELEKIKKLTPYEILKETKTFKEETKKFEDFLKKGPYNNGIDFTFLNSDKEINEGYWNFVKNLGEYGNLGETQIKRTKYYNPNIPLYGMMTQKYLDTFEELEKNGAINKNFSFNDLIKNNPFGFLPSNLSQMLFYINFLSLEQLFSVKNITKIKSRFNDIDGTFELLIFTTENKYYFQTDKEKDNALKSDVDFFKYIYDRSFEIIFKTKQWEFPHKFSNQFRFTHTQKSGTVWVIDRITNTDPEYWEFLLATNIHVFNLTNTFDKTIYEKYNKNVWNTNLPGFWANNTRDQNLERKNVYLKTNRGDTFELNNDFVVIDNGKNLSDSFSAYDQYLTAPYFIPRYNVSNIYLNDRDDLEKFFGSNKTKHVKTNNAGADFVTLRLKIKKNKLKNIFPNLENIIGTNKEKDWYINFNQNHFSLLKTQFYAGYPLKRNDNQNSEFRGVKSTGGAISSQKRIIYENDFQKLWLKYDKDLNKEYNSVNDNWKNMRLVL